MDYHPHVHLVVPGGALNPLRRQWKTLRGKYLFNEQALAQVFRARVLAAIREAGLALPNAVPSTWIAPCTHAGRGLPALKYLSRYLYRGGYWRATDYRRGRRTGHLPLPGQQDRR
ncbi:MAG: transposase [Halioglobus sp.]|nr:transposase [Halioglobus sp.]